MHEYVICQNLVRTILGELEKQGYSPSKLLTARVVVGKLRQIVPEILISAYTVLSKGTGLEGSKIEIISAPVWVKCEDCGWTGKIENFNFRCGACQGGRLKIFGGKELYLKSLIIKGDEKSRD